MVRQKSPLTLPVAENKPEIDWFLKISSRSRVSCLTGCHFAISRNLVFLIRTSQPSGLEKILQTFPNHCPKFLPSALKFLISRINSDALWNHSGCSRPLFSFPSWPYLSKWAQKISAPVNWFFTVPSPVSFSFTASWEPKATPSSPHTYSDTSSAVLLEQCPCHYGFYRWRCFR